MEGGGAMMGMGMSGRERVGGEMAETEMEVLVPAFLGVAPLILMGRAPINCPCISAMAL